MIDLLMRDSVDPFAIPLDSLSAVAGYGDGFWTWTPEGWARFAPPIVPLVIVVNPAHSGDILDVEQGDANPSDAPGWRQRFNRPARRAPTYYVNRANWPAVVEALTLAVAQQVDWFIATLDGTTDLWYGSPGTAPPAGLNVVAIQVRGSAQTGANYDESVILDPTWVGLEGNVSDGFTDNDRSMLNRLATDFFDGTQSTTADGKSPVPGGWPNFVPTQLVGITAMLTALTSAEGVDATAIKAIQSNGAAANQVNVLAGAVAAVKAELDNVAAAQAGGTPADLSALQTAIGAVDAHMTALGTHLGVNVSTGAQT